VAVKRFHFDHGKAGKALLEKGMLETSVEWASQGFGWQSTGVERRCNAMQASNQALHFFPELRSIALACSAHADSAGIYRPHQSPKWSMVEYGHEVILYCLGE